MKLANWMLLLALMQIHPGEVKAQEAFVPDETFDTFLQRFEDAQTRFVNGDPTAWIQMAAKDESVTIFGAFGGYEQGWVRSARGMNGRLLPPNKRMKLTNQSVIKFAYANLPPLCLAAYARR